MDKFLKTSRITVIFLFIAALLTVYGSTLYRLQIIEGEQYVEETAGTISTTSTVYASRGAILDRNGTVLAEDRTVYNVNISRSQLLQSSDPNGIVLSLVEDAAACGVAYADTFPVTFSAPFEYLADMSETQSTRLAAYKKFFKLREDISAPELVEWMRNHYGISYTLAPIEARRIIGVRFELEIRVIVNTTAYVFASDVDIDFITTILQRNYGCVSVDTSSVRQYYTPYASHIVGTMGRISGEEAEIYKEKGYASDAYIGKTGAESGFEDELHGVDGSVTTYRDASGAVTGVVVNSEAKAGSNVYLTIDYPLQVTAENALKATISSINAERTEEEELAEGGAAVVIDVNTAEMLAMASYPSFDLSTYRQDYSLLSADPLKPLMNRATQGIYNPGSTFKMVTAYAGLANYVIDPGTIIYDEHTYTAYDDYKPSCWSPVSHGWLDVVGALENSCNYFFYSVGDMLGANAISDTASLFGLGEKTGLEIYEVAGHTASPAYKQEALNESWWAADTLLSSIGQGHNMYTPVQLANYTATIANGGTHRSATLLKYITSSDYSAILRKREPEIINTVDDSLGFIGLLQKGMRRVVSSGTASSVFGDYPVPVAAKTGTVQSDTVAINTGVFVCYAPADEPEIAIVVVVENGGSGSAISTCARDILDAYFAEKQEMNAVFTDNSLAD